MGLKKTENQVQVLLKDTILALCRNTLNYHAEICIEGLLCITLDCEEVLLVNINQIIKNREVPNQEMPRRVRKKRKRTAAEIYSDDDDEIFGSVSPKAKCERSSKNKESAVVTLLNDQCNVLENSYDKDHKGSEDPSLSISEDIRLTDNTNRDSIDRSYEGPCIVKEEIQDVIVVKEENDKMLPTDEICHGYLSTTLNVNIEQGKNISDGASDYPHDHSIHSQGQISDDILPNLSHAIGGSELLGSLDGSTSMITAAGPMVHVCLLCGKSFAWQWLLKRHQVVHSGDKDYSCEHCQRTFSYQSSVKRHQENCAARLENLQCNSTIYPPGVSEQSAIIAGGTTSHRMNYHLIKSEQRTSVNFTKAATCTASGALSE